MYSLMESPSAELSWSSLHHYMTDGEQAKSAPVSVKNQDQGLCFWSVHTEEISAEMIGKSDECGDVKSMKRGRLVECGTLSVLCRRDLC